MPSTEWLEEEIRSILPNSDVEAIDLNGTQDHFHIRIIDESFSSMRPLQRQKLILNHFRDYIPSPIHAIDLKCMTPQQAQTAGDTVFHPHAGGTGIHIKRIQKHQNKAYTILNFSAQKMVKRFPPNPKNGSTPLVPGNP